MILKLLTEHHLAFLCLKGGCIGSSESTHVKMPHCWKSHVTAHLILRKDSCGPRPVLKTASDSQKAHKNFSSGMKCQAKNWNGAPKSSLAVQNISS